MKKKIATGITLILLVLSTLTFAFGIKPVKASGTIYIRADGGIEPDTAPISSVDNITYTFTGLVNDSIVVLRDNIVVDGAGYTVQGQGNGTGIELLNRSNVIIKNMEIKAFYRGIYLHYSSNNIIKGNNITNNEEDIVLHDYSSNNIIEGNNITNSDYGVVLRDYSSNIFIQGNNITDNNHSVVLRDHSSNNIIEGNNITNSDYGVVLRDYSSNNKFFHNNFIDNTQQVSIERSGYAHFWDNGYPSGGNYWSDHTGTDSYNGPYQNETGGDGIGDTPYVIDKNNQDNYPLMEPWIPKYMRSTRYPWFMFRHNLRHTAYTESPAPNTNQTLWNYTTGGEVLSSPSVAYGMVFVGSNDGNLYALDQYTGAHIWHYPLGNRVVSSPAVAGGRVYVGSSDGRVYCLDAVTGDFIWSHPIDGNVVSSPAVAYGRVYVGSSDGRVYCLDAVTGAHIWNYTTAGTVKSSPAVAGGMVYVGSSDNKTYSLDVSTGELIWSYPTGGSVVSSPAVAGGMVYVGSSDGRVYCLDAVTGDFIWSHPTGGSVYSSPAVAYGMVFVGSDDGNMYAIDQYTGTQIWHRPIGGGVVSSPAVADDRVYVGSSNSRVHCFDMVTGAHIWNYTTGGSVYSSPAVADGILFVGSDDNIVYSFGNVIRVPEDCPTIQEAIDVATPGATISIAPLLEPYHESIVLDSTFSGGTILGRLGSAPIFDGGGSGIAIIITGASDITVTNIVISNWDQGIFVDDSSNCRIYNNIVSSNDIAIDLTESSTGITIHSNAISENDIGINLSNSNNIIIYHNNFVDNTIPVQVSKSTGNIWHNGYPSGGNYWDGHTGIDDYRGLNQNEPGSDGIYDTAYSIDAANQDNYPLTKLYGGQHDIGIVNITTSKTVVGQGYNLEITVEILNYGIESETFNINAHAETTLINQIQITLTNRNSTTITFTWNTIGVAKGNYTITAKATPVPGETDTTDNTHTDGWVYVSYPGDVNGDGKVRVDDVLAIALAFGTDYGGPPNSNGRFYEPNLDINYDLKIRVDDILTAALNFGKG